MNGWLVVLLGVGALIVMLFGFYLVTEGPLARWAQRKELEKWKTLSEEEKAWEWANRHMWDH